MPRPSVSSPKGDPVPLAVEAQLDAVMHEPLALEALAHPHLLEQVDGPLLEHPGAHALLDVLAVARLEHHRLDPGAVEQLAEHEPGGTGSDDAHLCPLGHGHSL